MLASRRHTRRVENLMANAGCSRSCEQKRKFKATTSFRHDLPFAPNLLEQQFEPTAPNQQWLVAIT
jgi:transposase InsO family protein